MDAAIILIVSLPPVVVPFPNHVLSAVVYLLNIEKIEPDVWNVVTGVQYQKKSLSQLL